MTKPFFAIAIAALLIFYGCNSDSEKNIETSPSESLPIVVAPQEPANTEAPTNQNTEIEAIKSIKDVPGLPENFYGGNPQKVGEYFLYLLETGGIINVYDLEAEENNESDEAIAKNHMDIDAIIYTVNAYKASLFDGFPVKIVEFEKGDNSYELIFTMDVPEDNRKILEPGRQKWYLKLYSDGMTESSYYHSYDLYKLHELYPISRKEKYPPIDLYEDKYAFYVFTNRVFGYDGEYSSPAEIPKEYQRRYMMVNVPPSQEYATEAWESYIPDMENAETATKYITEKDMNLWSQKLFGTEFDSPNILDKVPPYIEQDENGENLYVTSYGWDPFFWEDNFLKSFEVGDEIHYYYQITNNDYTLTPVPTKILEYTIKDNMVWSCVDVTDEVGLSIY